MYLYVVLFAVIVTATADNTEDFNNCNTYLNSHCCDGVFGNRPFITDDVKECLLVPDLPGSCDKPLCFGMKTGISTADGTIKMDVLQKNLEEKLSDYKDILAAVKEECIDGSYASFGEPDECDLKKMYNCIRWHSIFRCPDFSDKESCKGVKDSAEKCLKLFSS